MKIIFISEFRKNLAKITNSLKIEKYLFLRKKSKIVGAYVDAELLANLLINYDKKEGIKALNFLEKAKYEGL